jgi:EpsI family protein
MAAYPIKNAEERGLVMPSLNRRKFVLGALGTGAALFSAAARPSTPINYLGNNKLQNVIPDRIGPWSFFTASGLVVPPEDQLSRALYSQLLTRVYTNGSKPPIMLLIAYSGGQTGILQIHRPEVCYPAGGFRLSPIVPRTVELSGVTVPVNTLTASADAEMEHILYWTRVGKDLPLTWRDQRLAVALANLRGFIPDAVLVRISTRRGNRNEAFAELQEFASELLQSMLPSQRRVLIGQA